MVIIMATLIIMAMIGPLAFLVNLFSGRVQGTAPSRDYKTGSDGPSAHPQWLAIPERGLFTGTMILGAVGSGTVDLVNQSAPRVHQIN